MSKMIPLIVIMEVPDCFQSPNEWTMHDLRYLDYVGKVVAIVEPEDLEVVEDDAH